MMNRTTYLSQLIIVFCLIFFSQNPKYLEKWNLEGGNPVNFTKLIWEKGEREVFNVVGSINKDLVRFYNNAGLFSVLWNLLYINLYKQAGAFFVDELKGKGAFYIGNEKFIWLYGTFF